MNYGENNKYFLLFQAYRKILLYYSQKISILIRIIKPQVRNDKDFLSFNV